MAKKPKFLLFENVKALIQQKFMPLFQEWMNELKSYGYTNYWAVLNAKEYDVPQNRERVFMVSILGEHESYNFPHTIPLTKCVEDYMLPIEEVDESYYISQERITLKVLSDILDQKNVKEEMETLYHQEEACRRMFGRRLKGKEWDEHFDEIATYAKNMRNEADSD